MLILQILIQRYDIFRCGSRWCCLSPSRCSCTCGPTQSRFTTDVSRQPDSLRYRPSGQGWSCRTVEAPGSGRPASPPGPLLSAFRRNGGTRYLQPSADCNFILRLIERFSSRFCAFCGSAQPPKESLIDVSIFRCSRALKRPNPLRPARDSRNGRSDNAARPERPPLCQNICLLPDLIVSCSNSLVGWGHHSNLNLSIRRLPQPPGALRPLVGSIDS